jgi:predicted NAD/FAD-binding protein
MKTVAVIGAGISGLAAEHFSSRRHRVRLFDKVSTLGGRGFHEDRLNSARRVSNAMGVEW